MKSERISAAEMELFFDRLWPICRSITGNGVRESLAILKEIIPFEIHEIASGTKVFDWEIPREWNIKEAYIITPDGRRICDFKTNNLSVVNYSIPVNLEISFEELLPHLHTVERLPDAIPYVTSYYREKWGFCLSQNELKTLPETGIYKVVIDSSLTNGSLTYADAFLKGDSEKEIVFSSYICHPSMANNELSGPLVMAFLYKLIAAMPSRKYSYRFVLAPETIGAITYLAKNGEQLKKNVIAGYVLTCVGTAAPFIYKKSKGGDSLADFAAGQMLENFGKSFCIDEFEPAGSDERQYCSPGFNLPFGSLMRSKYWEYPEYHTSFDNKELISFNAMIETTEAYFQMVNIFESASYFKNTVMFCEPNLGKRNLYPDLAGKLTMPDALMLRMRLLNFMDGTKTDIEFAAHYKYDLSLVQEEITILKNNSLLKSC